MTQTRSVIRGHAERGRGNRPGDAENQGGEQFLYADDLLWHDSQLREAITPWLTLSASVADHRALDWQLEAWSVLELAGNTFVARLASQPHYVNAGRRDSYIAHALWWSQPASAEFDPGMLLGQRSLFIEAGDEPRHKQPESLPSRPPMLDVVAHEEGSARRLLAHILEAHIRRQPVLVLADHHDFGRASPLIDLLAFARSALPLSLKRQCKLRSYASDPAYFARLGATLMVVNEEQLKVASRAIDPMILDARGHCKRGDEAGPVALDYAEVVLERAKRSSEAQLDFTARIDRFFTGAAGETTLTGDRLPLLVFHGLSALPYMDRQLHASLFTEFMVSQALRRRFASFDWSRAPSDDEWRPASDLHLAMIILDEDLPLPRRGDDPKASGPASFRRRVEALYNDRTQGTPQQVAENPFVQLLRARGDSSEPSEPNIDWKRGWQQRGWPKQVSLAQLERLAYLAGRKIASPSAVAEISQGVSTEQFLVAPQVALPILRAEVEADHPDPSLANAVFNCLSARNRDQAHLAELVRGSGYETRLLSLLCEQTTAGNLYPGWIAGCFEHDLDEDVEDKLISTILASTRDYAKDRRRQLPEPDDNQRLNLERADVRARIIGKLLHVDPTHNNPASAWATKIDALRELGWVADALPYLTAISDRSLKHLAPTQLAQLLAAVSEFDRGTNHRLVRLLSDHLVRNPSSVYTVVEAGMFSRWRTLATTTDCSQTAVIARHWLLTIPWSKLASAGTSPIERANQLARFVSPEDWQWIAQHLPQLPANDENWLLARRDPKALPWLAGPHLERQFRNLCSRCDSLESLADLATTYAAVSRHLPRDHQANSQTARTALHAFKQGAHQISHPDLLWAFVSSGQPNERLRVVEISQNDAQGFLTDADRLLAEASSELSQRRLSDGIVPLFYPNREPGVFEITDRHNLWDSEDFVRALIDVIAENPGHAGTKFDRHYFAKLDELALKFEIVATDVEHRRAPGLLPWANLISLAGYRHLAGALHPDGAVRSPNDPRSFFEALATPDFRVQHWSTYTPEQLFRFYQSAGLAIRALNHGDQINLAKHALNHVTLGAFDFFDQVAGTIEDRQSSHGMPLIPGVLIAACATDHDGPHGTDLRSVSTAFWQTYVARQGLTHANHESSSWWIALANSLAQSTRIGNRPDVRQHPYFSACAVLRAAHAWASSHRRSPEIRRAIHEAQKKWLNMTPTFTVHAEPERHRSTTKGMTDMLGADRNNPIFTLFGRVDGQSTSPQEFVDIRDFSEPSRRVMAFTYLPISPHNKVCQQITHLKPRSSERYREEIQLILGQVGGFCAIAESHSNGVAQLTWSSIPDRTYAPPTRILALHPTGEFHWLKPSSHCTFDLPHPEARCIVPASADQAQQDLVSFTKLLPNFPDGLRNSLLLSIAQSPEQARRDLLHQVTADQSQHQLPSAAGKRNFASRVQNFIGTSPSEVVRGPVGMLALAAVVVALAYTMTRSDEVRNMFASLIEKEPLLTKQTQERPDLPKDAAIVSDPIPPAHLPAVTDTDHPSEKSAESSEPVAPSTPQYIDFNSETLELLVKRATTGEGLFRWLDSENNKSDFEKKWPTPPKIGSTEWPDALKTIYFWKTVLDSTNSPNERISEETLALFEQALRTNKIDASLWETAKSELKAVSAATECSDDELFYGSITDQKKCTKGRLVGLCCASTHPQPTPSSKSSDRRNRSPKSPNYFKDFNTHFEEQGVHCQWKSIKVSRAGAKLKRDEKARVQPRKKAWEKLCDVQYQLIVH